MFKRAFLLECEKFDIDISFENIKSYPSILKKIEKFWAYPSYDTRCPPPHSTGGALDVCLSDKEEILLKWVAWLIKWMRPQILIFIQT